VGIRILRLSGTLSPGQAHVLAGAVLARLAGPGWPAGPGRAGASMPTVVLELEVTAGIAADGEAALRSLHERLRMTGIRLRLVIAAGPLRDRLRCAGCGPCAPALAVHPSLRSAVLAAYAELPGPGVVTPGVRAALAAPAEPLDRSGCFTPQGWGAAPRAVGELSTP
jgi:hypothetical protein